MGGGAKGGDDQDGTCRQPCHIALTYPNPRISTRKFGCWGMRRMGTMGKTLSGQSEVAKRNLNA
jgi:hypothetical protein